ncbi:MAG TPA: competence/damage-inducible protein A [Sedimenticola sp.]|nr:competence/damage-inducible protein A [Sedimenticola sp.]
MNTTNRFGLIVIGDEILIGGRQDRHLPHFRELLQNHGLQLLRCWFLSDEETSLTAHLHFSFESGVPTFVCGGIGATPDDLTRQCAARAAGVALERHPQAAALIEAGFGEGAYPERIHMADLPAGSELVPNPYNGIAGFSLRKHWFLPGFPEMAWPMAEWVLENQFRAAGERSPQQTREGALLVRGTPESSLIGVMKELSPRFPELKMFSLPRLGRGELVELGFRGTGDVGAALQVLRSALDARGIDYDETG